MDLWSIKATDSTTKGFSTSKFIRKSRIFTHTSHKSNHRRHTIKNYVLNELKRYIKYNSEKLVFLKLRNKFFDRLRNRGFRKYLLAKLFSSVSYASRNKYLTNDEKIYSNVIQETQADQLLIEEADKNFLQQPRNRTNNGGKQTGSSSRNDHFTNK